MGIETVRLENFKSFKDAELRNLPRFCVLVGANGSGKTTLFDVFGFLKDCLTFNVASAVGGRGGMKELLSRGADGQSLEIEIKFRMDIAGVERLVTYSVRICTGDRGVAIEREILKYKRSAWVSVPLSEFPLRQGLRHLQRGGFQQARRGARP